MPLRAEGAEPEGSASGCAGGVAADASKRQRSRAALYTVFGSLPSWFGYGPAAASPCGAKPAPLTVRRVPPSTGPAAGNTRDTEGSAWYMYGGPPTKSSSAELSVRLTTAARGTPPGAKSPSYTELLASAGGASTSSDESLAAFTSLGTPSKVSRASPAGWRSTIRLTVGSAGLRHS